MNHISLGELKELRAITAIQDGNHGDRHPVSADYVEDGVPFIMASDIVDGQINFKLCKKISRVQADTLRIGFAKTGDVLLTHKGTLGNVAVVPKVDPYLMLTPQVTYYRTNEALLHNRFLVYAFREPSFQGRMKRFSDQSTRPYVGITNQRYLKIPFPPLPVQKKIARILSAYDDLIENNLKRIKLLEELAQITYEEWFVRFRFPGHETTPINPTTNLPEGWRMGTMQDLFDFKNGYAFKSSTYVQDGQHKIVTIKNVQDGSFIPETTDTIAELPNNIKAHHHLSTGDIIMSLTGNVGRVCLVYGEDYLLNQRVAKVVPNTPADRLYIYALLRSRGTLTQLENISNGAAQQNLSPVNASKMPALVPSRNVLNNFNKTIGDIINLICLKNIENQRLREARDTLLPRLMTGMIDVDQYHPENLIKDAA